MLHPHHKQVEELDDPFGPSQLYPSATGHYELTPGACSCHQISEQRPSSPFSSQPTAGTCRAAPGSRQTPQLLSHSTRGARTPPQPPQPPLRGG